MSVNFNGINGVENQYLFGTTSAAQTEQTEGTIFDSVNKSEDDAELNKALEEYTEAAAAVGETVTTSDVKDKSLEDIQEEIDDLKEEKEALEKKMEKVEDKIEDLAESAQKNIEEALATQENAIEEYNEDAEKALKDNIKAYIEANKEGGEGMTRDQLQENIKTSLPNQPGLADAIAKLTAASRDINEIDALLGDLNGYIEEAKSLDNEISLKQGEYDDAKAEEEAKKCCDPIGFVMGEGEDKAQYDFIVDDGAFDSTNDFLGADNQWAAMTALDTDGDSVVTSEELKAGNIKAVKTDAAGNQTVVDIAEEFGNDFSVDLNSFRAGGSHSAVDTNADADGNGIKDQTLLGTFNVNVNGEKVQGYDTLDDNSYLESKYNLSSGNAEAAATTEGISDGLQAHTNFFNIYTERSAQLKENLKSAYEQLGLTDEEIDGINEATKVEAQEEVQSFYASLATEDQQKIDDLENGTSCII